MVSVSSGVPQGSVLGPLLFTIYINDIDCGLASKLWKFADDTKICSNVDSVVGNIKLQEDLDKLYNWSLKWQMKFNIDKCSVVHLGHNNVKYNYTLSNQLLHKSDLERDLGIFVDSKAKFSEQCNKAVNKANATLGIIRRHFVCKNKNNLVRLYKALVRPKLEYCVQVWRPFLKKDIDIIEKVQHRATKMIPECRHLSYEHRLKNTGLCSLEKRREKGDLIQTFKLIKGVDKINYRKFFQLSNSNRTIEVIILN